MNCSEEGQPTGFGPPATVPPHQLVAQSQPQRRSASFHPVALSQRVIVTNVATDFRVEKVNPLGEANRLIVAVTVTFNAPGMNPPTSRLFRRYYVYEATDFTPERLVATLRDMASDIDTAAAEVRSGAPCTFDVEGLPVRSRRRRPRRPERD